MYVKALCDEIELRKGYISEPIQTVYFGGGTPSLLSLENIQIIWNKLNETFDKGVIVRYLLSENLNDEFTLADERLTDGDKVFYKIKVLRQ